MVVLQIYIYTVSSIHTTGLASGLNVGNVGRFTIGNGNRLAKPAIMDFYGLFFYNRSLTDSELNLKHLYLINAFKI